LSFLLIFHDSYYPIHTLPSFEELVRKEMEQTSSQPKTDIAGYTVEEMKRQTEQSVKDIFPI